MSQVAKSASAFVRAFLAILVLELEDIVVRLVRPPKLADVHGDRWTVRHRHCVAPREKGHRASRLFAVHGIYFILVSAAISSLPSAVLIVSCTGSPLPPAGIVAKMRFPFFGSAVTASSNNTVSLRFSITRNGVAGSTLKN